MEEDPINLKFIVFNNNIEIQSFFKSNLKDKKDIVYIDYINIVNKLQKNDFYKKEPSDTIVYIQIKKLLEKAIKNNKNIVYTIKKDKDIFDISNNVLEIVKKLKKDNRDIKYNFKYL